MLSARFQVSRQTVRHAIGILEEQGLVIRRQGSGTYVRRENEAHVRNTKTIGIIATYISEYILPSMIRGIEEVTAENGYSFILRSTGNRMDNEKDVLSYFLENPVDGLIVEGSKTAFPNPNLNIYQKIVDSGIPIVFLSGFYPALGKCIYVVSDNYGGGKQAAELLISKGHRRIGGIFKADDNQGHDRFAGFIDAARTAGIELHDKSLLWFTTEMREQLFENGNAEKILASLEECTAVICYNDQIAAPLLSSLLRAGKRVPEDVAIISFDDSSYASLTPVKLTSLGHPKEEIGRVAARKLLNMIAGKKESPAVLGWTLAEKESTMFSRAAEIK
jgi:GntR family transcriptional regulator of arabinose operon